MISCEAIMKPVEAAIRAYENESARVSALIAELKEGQLDALGAEKVQGLTTAINTAKKEYEKASSEVAAIFKALDAKIAEEARAIKEVVDQLERSLSGNQSDKGVF